MGHSTWLQRIVAQRILALRCLRAAAQGFGSGVFPTDLKSAAASDAGGLQPAPAMSAQRPPQQRPEPPRAFFQLLGREQAEREPQLVLAAALREEA